MTSTMAMTLVSLFALIDAIKVDGRKHYIVALDTETIGVLTFPRFYDLGFAIVDKYNHVYFKVSLVNSTIFYGHKDEMQTCYYANKLPQYFVELENGERCLLNVWQIKELIAYVMKHFDTKTVAAYNANFDKRACNNTLKEFFHDDTIFWDIMLMVKDTIYEMASYKKFCAENGFMCSGSWSDRPKWSAEVVYRFITKNPDFVEAHTGLRDVEIESAIMAECFKKHAKMRKVLGTKKSA